MSNQKRQPAGVPVGGQFATNEHDAATGTLAHDRVSLVRDMYGDVKTFEQIAQEHGVASDSESIAAWAAENNQEVLSQERIELGEDTIDFDDIASAYRSNGDHDIAEVYVSPNAGSGADDEAAVVVRATGNLRWNDEFSDEELDAHYPVVEEAYRQWFNADINVPESWDSFDVEMSKDVPRSTLCDATVNEAAWDIAAKWKNETDPGTFGSPYFGARLRAMIDDSRVLENGHNREAGVVPTDLTKESFSDGEALAIAKEIHLQASEIDGRDGVDLAPLRKFQDTGVLSISGTETAISNVFKHQREVGTLTANRADRIEELSAALTRWVESKPDYAAD